LLRQFLSGVLYSLEQVGAPSAAVASHKLSNAWYKAFDVIYSDVASDCSVPTGKNRYHKFKDKIVELWLAMEEHAPTDHPLKQKALDQLEEYRKACAAAQSRHNAMTSPSKDGSGTGSSDRVTGTSGGKRPYTSSFCGSIRWKHLNETEALTNVPEPLQSLIHLRHLAAELGAGKTNVEETYQKALDDYLKETVTEKDALYNRALSLAALSRQTLSNKESRDISLAYESALQEYLAKISPAPVTV